MQTFVAVIGNATLDQAYYGPPEEYQLHINSNTSSHPALVISAQYPGALLSCLASIHARCQLFIVFMQAKQPVCACWQ